MPHSFWSRVHPRLIACGAVLAIAQPLSAQQRVIIAGGQGANVVTLSSLALPDSAVRRLIETHLPDAFNDDADAHHEAYLSKAPRREMQRDIAEFIARTLRDDVRDSRSDSSIAMPTASPSRKLVSR